MRIGKTLIVFFAGLLIALPIRIFQVLYATGYIMSSPELDRYDQIASILLLIVLSACAVLIPILSLSSRKFPRFAVKAKAGAMGIISLLAAIAIGAAVVLDFLKYPDLQYPGIKGIFCDALGALSAVSFLILSTNFFSGKKFIERASIIMIFPALWVGIRLILLFFATLEVAEVHEVKYDLITMAFLAVFLTSVSKFLSGSGDRAAKTVFAVGGPAAIFAFATNLPRYLVSLDVSMTGTALPVEQSQYLPMAPETFLGIFAAGMMLHMIRRSRIPDPAVPYVGEPLDLKSLAPLSNGNGQPGRGRNTPQRRQAPGRRPVIGIGSVPQHPYMDTIIHAGAAPAPHASYDAADYRPGAASAKTQNMINQQNSEFKNLAAEVDDSLGNMYAQNRQNLPPSEISINLDPEDFPAEYDASSPEQDVKLRLTTGFADRLEEQRAAELAAARSARPIADPFENFGKDIIPFEPYGGEPEQEAPVPEPEPEPEPVQKADYEIILEDEYE